ncbi:PREDICTED: acrosomal protein SP-10 [Galeopterus variegatus]|uniref:Acrosomal protein SP-10 n=1 Tax=Galeopterus variegatus TaxID=482537 RepID=A0ABM0SF85_GALVR|nr:PREDICTED: acrosomal protein SP-10 [Galeopterus variegatus]
MEECTLGTILLLSSCKSAPTMSGFLVTAGASWTSRKGFCTQNGPVVSACSPRGQEGIPVEQSLPHSLSPSPSLFCSFSIPGASGQPDEPPGSMHHEASVQQFSGEYSSLGNPSDAEALYETYSGKNTLSEHGSSEHSSSHRAMVEHTAGEHTAGEQSSDEKPSREHTLAEQPSGEQPSAEKPSGEQALGEQAPGEQAPGEQAPGEQAPGEQASGEQPSGEKPSAEQASEGEKASGEQALGENPSGEQTSVEQASGEKSSAEQASGEQPSMEQASGEQPSGAPFSSTSSGTILNCHTCAYMNDQGKCLRGEGVCTTENSQQCMLKKIFEGGKLQFMVQGCENMCPSMNLFSHGTRMQIICCKNQPFCNNV